MNRPPAEPPAPDTSRSGVAPAGSAPTRPALPTAGEGIALRGVSKRFVDDAATPPAVDAIDLVVPRGTLTTILGPSGCGKTTVLRMIAGLERPSAGSVWIDGRDATGLPAAERNVGMVFQSYALFPHMDVLANVAYGLRVAGLARDDARERARAAMAGVGLVGLDARLPSELSGGQQQRVALARALVTEPSVLLFDEPLSNLDARLRRTMRDEIRGLQQRLGLTVAYVTHDQAEALAVSDHIVVMERGRIAQLGTPRALYERPASRFVATFMGEATLVDGRIGPDGVLQVGPMCCAAPAGARPGPASVAIRPEAWRLRPPGKDALPATVVKCAYLGALTEVTLDSALGTIFLTAGTDRADLAPGTIVGLGLGTHGIAIVGA